jgi:hypothetical protein
MAAPARRSIVQFSSHTPKTPSTRSGALVLALLVFVGCSTVGFPPPTGSMWAFFTDADLVLGPRAIVYMTSQVSCEIERRRRLEYTQACAQVIVSAGTGYYAVSLPSNVDAALPGGATFGSLDQERCERLRTTLFRSYNTMGDCGPVAVKRTP